jgi:hypothetical protein
MKAGRIVALVIGCLMALSAFGLLTAGAVLGWAVGTQRDADGFFQTSERRFETSTFAIISEDVDLGTGPGPQWWSERDLATVRIQATNAIDDDIFVGIGPSDDVTAYLDGVRHVTVTDVDFGPFRVTYRTAHPQAELPPAPPGDQTFWAASATGPGQQSVTWDLEPGRWTVVVMHPAATAGIAADLDIGGRIQYLPQVALGLGAAGLLVGIISAILVVWAVAGLSRLPANTGAPLGTPASAVVGRPSPVAVPLPGPGPGPGPGLTDTGSPLRLEGRLQADLNRGLWLVKWFLAIPHFIVLAFLFAAYGVLTIVAFFAIVFTGRYPRSIFEFNVGVLRWAWRVMFYATNAIGTDRYPPFSFDAATDYPATLEVVYPEHLSRGLVWVKSWLLAIPHLIIVSVFAGWWGVRRWSDDGWGMAGGGLITLLVVIAGVALLFTRRYPLSLFDLLLGLNRWVFRVVIYVSLMTDRYPPFRLDQGGTEPTTGPAAPAATAPTPAAPLTPPDPGAQA